MTATARRPYNQLLAIHTMLQERHYVRTFEHSEVIGSPFIADFAHEILDEIIRRDLADNPARAREYEKWRLLTPERREFHMIELRIDDIEDWLEWSNNRRQGYILAMASPYRLSEENLDRLIRRGEGENA